MDQPAREVLKKFKQEIKRNLNLDDDILDTLEANGTLKSDHVEKIKAEKTNSEKISTLLLILQRKGPEAFQAFIDAIKTEYNFLANKLLDRYQEEEKKLDKDSGNSSEGSLEITENQSSGISNTSKEVTPPVSTSQANGSLNYGHTANRSQETGVSAGLLQQDRHSVRRQSNHSSELTIHPTNHFLQTNHSSRRTSNHSIDFSTHNNLNRMYTKLKMILFHINVREQSFTSSPVPVNFEMVEDLLDELLKLVQDCYKAVGGNNKESLLTCIVNLKLLRRELQTNLNKKEEQTQKYATKIHKYETKCKNNEITMKQQDNEIASLKLENKRLNEENEKFKEENSRLKHTEETEGEAHLKNFSLRQVSKQNEELRKRVSKYEKDLEMMTLKLNTLNQWKQNHSNHQKSELSNIDIETVNENGKEKNTDVKEKRCETNKPNRSTTSTLLECREICAGTNSKLERNNLQHLRKKILFAEAKRYGGKKVKDSGENSELLERVSTVDKMAGQEEELNERGRQYHKTSNPSETIAKLGTNKHTLDTFLKQSSSAQLVKKQVTYKSSKKNPRWIRKPLK